MKAVFVLHGDSQAKACYEEISARRKNMANGGKAPKVTVEDEDTRSERQNRMMHSMFGDLAKQVKWHGQKLGIDVWKRLCMAAYLREAKQSPMMIPALDGNGIDIVYEKTSRMTVRAGSELIEWVGAFGAEHDVNWTKFGKLPEDQW